MADTIRYCTNCQKNVVAKTKINWLIFIILLILGIILGIVYLKRDEGKVDVNLEMVKTGNAWHYSYHDSEIILEI